MLKSFMTLFFVVGFAQSLLAESWVPLTRKFSPFTRKEQREVFYNESQEGSLRKINISLPGLLFKEKNNEKGTFFEIRVPNEGFTTVVGEAKLPVIRRLVKVPENGKIKLLDTKVSRSRFDVEDNIGKGKIFPLQRSHSKGDKSKPKFVINERSYRKDSFDNKEIVKIGEKLRIKGESFVTVEFYPFSYNPSKNIINISASVNFELKIDGEESSQNDELERPGLMIIVGDAFKDSDSYLEYVNWKKMMGFVVKNVNLSSIGQTPLDVRTFMLNEYKNWKIDYLVIVGDVEHVPTHTGTAMNRNQATDNFYATLDTVDYLSDITTPDISVGRFPVKTEAELSVVIGKILKYERAEFSSTNWIKKIAFLGTSDKGWYHVAEGTHNYVIDNFTKDLGFSGIFPENPIPGGDKLYAITYSANTRNVLNSLNEGRVILNYSGHGANTYWDGPRFTKDDINNLTHSDATPYVVSNACITGTFAMTGDSFSEMWIKAPRGALAFYGASHNSYWEEDDILEKKMWEHLFKNKAHRIGDINYHGLENIRLYYNNGGKTAYYYEIYNLMGDPTTPLYTEIPTQLYIDADPIILGSQFAQIRIFNQDGPVKGANVLLKDKSQDFEVFAVSDHNGMANLYFDSNLLIPGEAKIIVSAFNHVYNIDNIAIVSPHGPYYLVDSYSIEIPENRVSSFETFDIKFSLKNVGQETGSPRLEELALPEGVLYKAKIDGGCDLIILEPKEVQECQGTYRFSINKAFFDKTNLSFKMLAKSGDYENELKFSMSVSAPSYEFSEVAIEEVSGNANGFIDQGEYVDISFTLKNVGSKAKVADLLKLDLKDSCLIAQDSLVSELELMDEGSEIIKKFTFQVSEDCPNGFVTKFEPSIVSGQEESFIYGSKSFEQIIGTKEEKTFVSENLINIPDNNQSGIEVTLDVPDNIIIDKVNVFVDIVHTYIGDLHVELFSPDGLSVVLHGKTGAGNDNIYGWYGRDLVSHEPLNAFKMTSSLGKWVIKIKDTALNDVGKLRGWKLYLEGYLR